MANQLIIVGEGGVALPRTTIRDHMVLVNFNDLAGWSVKNTDTVNMGLDTKHISDTNSIKFDKVDSAANDTESLIQNSLTNLIDASRMLIDGIISTSFYVSSLANVINIFVRIGSDNGNYNQWTWTNELLIANKWNTVEKRIKETDFADSGVGWNQVFIGYVALGVTFRLETNTLTDIRFDNISFSGK